MFQHLIFRQSWSCRDVVSENKRVWKTFFLIFDNGEYWKASENVKNCWDEVRYYFTVFISVVGIIFVGVGNATDISLFLCYLSSWIKIHDYTLLLILFYLHLISFTLLHFHSQFPPPPLLLSLSFLPLSLIYFPFLPFFPLSHSLLLLFFNVHLIYVSEGIPCLDFTMLFSWVTPKRGLKFWRARTNYLWRTSLQRLMVSLTALKGAILLLH